MNEFTDWKTQSIGQLTNLQELELSKNSIRSTIDEHHLSKLDSLKRMDASFNSLTFNKSSEWVPPFNLVRLSLASCNLGTKFPQWIQSQTEIDVLDFSDTQISDTIPMWFWDTISIRELDASSNKIRGRVSLSSDIEVIDLSSNYFEGPIPPIPQNCFKMNLSHNKFTGKLLSTSELPTMALLDLSHNLLIGELIDSLIQCHDLVFLDLGSNNFSGRIPIPIGYLSSVQTLILRKNSFHGELPESLRYCTNLGFVDFSLNSLSGTMPTWIGQDLPRLYALILKSNKFYGNIPNDLCHLPDLHFLDLPMNRISGNIPQCFSNLTAMIKNGTTTTDHSYKLATSPECARLCRYYSPQTVTDSYLDDALAGWKGQNREFGRNFAYLKMIDLYNNELTGEFPMGITKLLELNGLNQSSNKFHGKIPTQIGGLFKLENLDLSNNKFSGEIPQTMSRLNFIAYLNLSSNNFLGKIPLGGQLQTFESSTFENNAGLCGLPLKERCRGPCGHEADVENEVDEDKILYERGLYLSAAVGFETTFWGICLTLLLNRQRRHAYFLFLTNMKDQFYVFMAVAYSD